MSDYFLGVDGGKSSTCALIGDRTGRVLGCGYSGPSNHVGEVYECDSRLSCRRVRRGGFGCVGNTVFVFLPGIQWGSSG